ncbi:ABC transporter ATP-binding protein [Oenococcus oeni]|uniref:ABC transporter ATP-binding protein n=1 Tax=Oenococcus oeni TaxID=1247 RepID=UPI000277B49F|nr:ABC transporter ATP-binding protein [Oenococcus oeni]EJO06846.1 ABC-type dipeptide/oligopeptide/nickel transport system, ATPase component [Oenococcus oeni AWRIB422]EJO07847.1 ABC-type dipeptide/oligopeptide/nickel transport system, ATPase component [Oenococcus oeni AWRIB548]KEP85845.1 peptide ABC transporter ATP-binding protein [Oenococcus oeni IOEB_0205]KGH67170.1 peptide ABC transporter ATP-binding protein [Oenococcus oeni IOEB_B16]OIL81495.1 peptide ABC transporter ATP-binding protein [O
MTEKLVLQVKNLSVEFHTYAGTIKAIRNVSFELNKGETLAIVGESGSGKSVTTHTLMGLNASNATISAGHIFYKGKDLLKFSEEEFEELRGGEVAMIFQDPMTSLDPTMKIGKQIMEVILLHDEDIEKEQAAAKALELMKQVGIPNAEEHFQDYPHQWSGGMRQRAVIAVALAGNPDILIADEPTTALDVTIQAQILHLMKEIQSEIDSSIIFITHDLGVVAGMADKVAVMYAGQIVEYGTTEEIFYNPQHPYTWGLLNSMPTTDIDTDELSSIPGTPPDLLNLPKGDPFAPRNRYALDIDYEEEPPFFQLSDTHYAATWLLDKRAPKITPPKEILKRWDKWKKFGSKSALPKISKFGVAGKKKTAKETAVPKSGAEVTGKDNI